LSVDMAVSAVYGSTTTPYRRRPTMVETASTVTWRRLGAAVDHVVVWMTSCVVRFVVVLCTTSPGCLDRRPSSPLVVSALPVDELYLASGLTGRLSCPFTEDPPDSLVVWTKDGRPLDAASWRRSDDSDEVDGQRRVKLARGGTLVFSAASTPDEGVYTCLVYSPLHKGPESTPVRVLVRGKSNLHAIRCVVAGTNSARTGCVIAQS